MAQRVANTSSRGYIINRFAFSIVQLRDGNLFTRLRREDGYFSSVNHRDASCTLQLLKAFPSCFEELNINLHI